MGDRTSVVIEIGGGPLSPEQFGELCDCIRADLLGIDWTDYDPSNDDLAAHAEGGSLYLTGAEINYAEVENTQDFCREHGLTYRKEWDAGGDYGAGGELRTPEGVCEYAATSIGGGPCLHTDEIRRLGSWAALMEHIERLHQRIPPLTITPADAKADA